MSTARMLTWVHAAIAVRAIWVMGAIRMIVVALTVMGAIRMIVVAL